jgi:hypothetical protein
MFSRGGRNRKTAPSAPQEQDADPGLWLPWCALRRFHGVVEMEELLDPGYLHGVANALGNSYQRKATAVLLMVHVSSYQRSDACRIDVGNTGEIQDKVPRSVAAYHRLELKEVGENDRTTQAQHALA